MEIKIIRVEHGKDELFTKVAYASLNERVQKELGYPLKSQLGQTWFIAIDGDDLAGFCSFKVIGNRINLCHAYVFRLYRNAGIYRKLFKERDEYLSKFKSDQYAICTPLSLKTYTNNGFIITKRLKNYIHVTRKFK